VALAFEHGDTAAQRKDLVLQIARARQGAREEQDQDEEPDRHKQDEKENERQHATPPSVVCRKTMPSRIKNGDCGRTAPRDVLNPNDDKG
jgi:hypothetical protein